MPKPQTFRARVRRWAIRIAKAAAFVVGIYLLIGAVGLIPVNNGFESPANGITIFVSSNDVHADIILPVFTDTIDWSQEFCEIEFNGDISSKSHVAFGWGDRGFFINTPTWDEFELSAAIYAILWPSECCMHLDFTLPEEYSDTVAVTISAKQYAALVDHIKDSFRNDARGKYLQIGRHSYGSTDAFCEATGHYHLFNTCNSWVVRGLKRTGIRSPWFATWPRTPLLYLKNEQDAG